MNHHCYMNVDFSLPATFPHRFYATVTMHFEPVGYSYELKQQRKEKTLGQSTPSRNEQARDMFHKALDIQQLTQKKKTDMMQQQELPLYVVPNSEQAERFAQRFIFQREPKKPRKLQMTAYVIIVARLNMEENRQLRCISHTTTIIEQLIIRSGATSAHTVAANGDLDALKKVVENDPTVVDKADVNGWCGQRGDEDHCIILHLSKALTR